MNGKNGVPGGKNISQMQWKPYYDINLDEAFTSTKVQANKTTINNNTERATHAHIHSTHPHPHTIAVLW